MCNNVGRSMLWSGTPQADAKRPTPASISALRHQKKIQLRSRRSAPYRNLAQKTIRARNRFRAERTASILSLHLFKGSGGLTSATLASREAPASGHRLSSPSAPFVSSTPSSAPEERPCASRSRPGSRPSVLSPPRAVPGGVSVGNPSM